MSIARALKRPTGRRRSFAAPAEALAWRASRQRKHAALDRMRDAAYE